MAAQTGRQACSMQCAQGCSKTTAQAGVRACRHLAWSLRWAYCVAVHCEGGARQRPMAATAGKRPPAAEPAELCRQRRGVWGVLLRAAWPGAGESWAGRWVAQAGIPGGGGCQGGACGPGTPTRASWASLPREVHTCVRLHERLRM